MTSTMHGLFGDAPRRRATAAFIVAVLLSGCQVDESLQPQRASVAQLSQILRASASMRTLDDEFADVADAIPGFGGFYFDHDGQVVVVMLEPQLLDSYRSALGDALRAAQAKRPVSRPQRALSFAEARAVQGQFNYRQMFNVYRGVFREALSEIPGLVMTDIDEARNRIAIGVSSGDDTARTATILVSRGVPRDMFEVFVTASPSPNYLLSDTLRPVPGGARIMVTISADPLTLTPCTVGFNLLHYAGQTYEPPESARYTITNSHCTQTQWDSESSQIWQGNGYVAQEYGDPAGFTGSPCNFQKVCRYSDASLFQYYDDDDADDGRVAYPATEGDTSFSSYKTLSWIDTPYYGMPVHMIGASSGRRVGNVIYTCVDVYNIPTFGNKGLLCQNTALYISGDGDSGAPVITLYGDGSVSATGQHWGNYTSQGQLYYSYFSAMYMILDEFYSAFGSMYLSPFVY